jgi:hypothetical protein
VRIAHASLTKPTALTAIQIGDPSQLDVGRGSGWQKPVRRSTASASTTTTRTLWRQPAMTLARSTRKRPAGSTARSRTPRPRRTRASSRSRTCRPTSSSRTRCSARSSTPALARADSLQMARSQTLRAANIIRDAEWDSDTGSTAPSSATNLPVKSVRRSRSSGRSSTPRWPPNTRLLDGRTLADELADVVICVDLLALKFGSSSIAPRLRRVENRRDATR